jgi:ADP-ribosylglycohydrolase
MGPFVKYIYLAEREWAQSQRYRANPGRTFCWLSRTRSMCTRRCMDTGMLDTILRGKPGAVEDPVNKSQSVGALLLAVAVGLFSNGERAQQSEIDRLAAEAVALTHGSPSAFLPAAMLAHMISNAIREPELPVETLVNLTNIAEKENAAELLLEAKGFADPIVNIVDNEVDVVINASSVTDRQIAQIEDIVTRKTGFEPKDITITAAIQED